MDKIKYCKKCKCKTIWTKLGCSECPFHCIIYLTKSKQMKYFKVVN